MPSRFGGQIDASGILSDVYNRDMAAREQATQQAVRRATEEQNALDRDAQERWQAGQMSDADWLEYARKRVADSVGFPDEQSQWKKILRDSTDSIAVNQAESAYQNGGSINQLIAFYQQRVKGMSGASGAARDALTRLNQLQDKRLSDEIQQGATQIQDQIDAGNARPEALLAFLQQSRARARAGSDIAHTIDTDISQVKNQITKFQKEYAIQSLQHDWESGSITGTEYAARMRGLAQGYQDDPSAYFNMLAEAETGDRYGQFAFDGSGSGGRSSGSGGGGSARGGVAGSKPKSVSDYMAQWDDRRWRGEEILKQVLAGKTEVVDPGTQDSIDVTTESGKRWLANVNRDVVSTYNAQNAMGAQIGRPDMQQKAQDGVSKFILDLAQPSNTLLDTEAEGHLLQSIQNGLDTLDTRELDPRMARAALDNYADQIDRYVRQKSETSVFNPRTLGMFIGQGAAEEIAKKAPKRAANPENSLDAARIAELTQFSSALRTGKYEDGAFGNNSFIKPAYVKQVAQARLVTEDKVDGLGTRWTYAVLPGEGPTIVPMVMSTRQVTNPETGEAQIVEAPQIDPKALSDAGIDSKVFTPVDIGVQVGHSVVRALGFASYQASPWQVWQFTKSYKSETLGGTLEKGKYLDTETQAKLGTEFATLAANGYIQKVGLPVMTLQAPNGRGGTDTWTQLPGGTWTKGLYPIKPHPHADGTVDIDANGSLTGLMTPTEDVPAPFFGTDPKLMQAAVDRGEFDDVIAQKVKTNWKTGGPLMDQPYVASGMYWNQQDEQNRLKANSAWTESSLSTAARQSEWWDSKGRAERAADAWNATTRAARDEAKNAAAAASAPSGGNIVSQLFAEEGGALGLSFGGPAARQQGQDQQAVAPTSWPDAQMPKVSLPPIRPGTLAPVEPEVFNLPAPQASSGPHLVRTGDSATPNPQPATGGSFLGGLYDIMARVRRTPSPTPAPPTPTTPTRSNTRYIR